MERDTDIASVEEAARALFDCDRCGMRTADPTTEGCDAAADGRHVWLYVGIEGEEEPEMCWDVVVWQCICCGYTSSHESALYCEKSPTAQHEMVQL